MAWKFGQYENELKLRLHLGKEPEFSTTKNGNKSARFSIAVSRQKFKDAPDRTDWLNIMAYGKTAEFFEKMESRKGDWVEVLARVTQDRVEKVDDKGEKTFVNYFNIVAFEITNFSAKERRKGQYHALKEPAGNGDAVFHGSEEEEGSSVL